VYKRAVSDTHDRLEALADRLEQSGDDPFRVTLLRSAQRFKRSWLELAKALHELQSRRAFDRWGYADLHEYCQKELSIRPSTVDKLLLSYGTVQRHAPEVLAPSRERAEVPSFDAVDYFARAIGREESAGKRLDAAPEVIDKLRAAVFEEGRSLPELRGEFGPLLRPKAAEADDAVSRARTTAQRLLTLLPNVPGITEARMARTCAALEALVRDLEAMEPEKEKAEAVSAPRVARARKKQNA
jgi:hypothetical protein